ncbi:MAG: hypothetical protein RBJ76_13740 [Stenomitos frigidus ULC029]
MIHRWLHSESFSVVLFVADVSATAITGQLCFFNLQLPEQVVIASESGDFIFTVRIPEKLRGNPTHSTAKNITLELVNNV